MSSTDQNISICPPLKEIIRCSDKNNTNLYVSSAYSEGRKLCLDYIDAMEYAKHAIKNHKTGKIHNIIRDRRKDEYHYERSELCLLHERRTP